MVPPLADTFFRGTQQHRLVSFVLSGSPSGVLYHPVSKEQQSKNHVPLPVEEHGYEL